MPNTKVDPTTPDKSSDPRHLRREQLLQELFACTFIPESTERAKVTASSEIKELLNQLDALDAELTAVAPERPLGDINKVDLAVLRLMLWEARHTKTPKKVLLNEAIELAKTFGTASSPKFVNATLARLLLE